MPTLRKARALRPGARVGIAAPAGVVDANRLEEGEQSLRALGFEPVRRGDPLKRSGYLAGDDDRRARELAELVADSDVEAIVCARGGYGSGRLIGRLDADAFRRARKPLVGYSDLTALLLWQSRLVGLAGIHGPMLEREGSLSGPAGESLRRALTGSDVGEKLPGRPLASGRAEGRLIGGSLSLVTASLGTSWEIDARGGILMFEEVSEPPYRIDRMLEQLRAAGKFDDLAGVGVGSLQGCEDDRYPDRDVEVVLRDFLGPLEVPVVVDLPFGHGPVNRCWPVGGRARLDADRAELELLESAVEAL